jgi:pilus assembly protein Flp/PilA
MNALMPAARRAIRAFASAEDGAQVVEYALIIAVVSITLAIALQALTDIPLATLIARVGNCLAGTCA